MYLGEFKFIYETILDYESGDQMGSFDIKNPQSKISCLGTFKGSVQQKVRWVENGGIQRVRALHRGTGYYFVDLGGLHLVYSFSPFPVSTTQIIGKFWKNR
jgi:hypothetical protein